MAAVIIADQLTKWAILHLARLSPPGCLETGAGCRRIELSPLVDLTMVWNYGVSFGLFKSDGAGRWALMAFAVGVAAFFGRWLLKSERRLAAAGQRFQRLCRALRDIAHAVHVEDHPILANGIDDARELSNHARLPIMDACPGR